MAEEPQERPRNRGKTRADTLKVLVRRQFVFQLRRRGATYETIFQAARQRFGAQLPKSYDRRQVYKDVLAELTHLQTELAEAVEAVRHLDLDGLDSMSQDPDWAVGTLMAELNGQYWIINVLRVRLSPKGVEDLVRQTAALDGRGVDILIEQEPGASGKTVIEDYQRRVLRGYSVYAVPATGAKTERAKPASSAAEAGNIFLVRGPWITTWLDEVALFPLVAHDDQTDTLAHGVNYLSKCPPLRVW
jgi:predicted phage terminase large subunit-like protein